MKKRPGRSDRGQNGRQVSMILTNAGEDCWERDRGRSRLALEPAEEARSNGQEHSANDGDLIESASSADILT
jgi:hypothetical protein